MTCIDTEFLTSYDLYSPLKGIWEWNCFEISCVMLALKNNHMRVVANKPPSGEITLSPNRLMSLDATFRRTTTQLHRKTASQWHSKLTSRFSNYVLSVQRALIQLKSIHIFSSFDLVKFLCKLKLSCYKIHVGISRLL